MRRLTLGGALMLVSILAVSLGPAVISGGAAQESARAQARVIYLSAVEWKGEANVSQEAFPGAPLPSGGGYKLVAPDAAGDWEVETYRFDTAASVAYEGERVVLVILGVNARQHDIAIPAFNRSFTVKRGQLTKVRFVANKAGSFKMICRTHPPSMVMDLVVLPKR